MSFSLQCSCGTRFDAGMESAGKQASCPNCGRVLNLPTAEECAAVTGEVAPSREREHEVRESSGTIENQAIDGQQGLSEGPARPPYRLASALQVGVATFFGGPLGGFLLMGRNYFRLGRRAAGFEMVTVGFILAGLVVVIAFMLPDSARFGGFYLGALLVAMSYATAKGTQGTILQRHQDSGGELVSIWSVAGFALLGLVVTLAVIFGGAALYEAGFGDRFLRVNDLEEIHYSRDITETEVSELARVLQEQGFFNGNRAKTVGLRKDGGEYVISFVLSSGFYDLRIQKEFLDLAAEISHALGGKPVRIDLCDSWETPQMKLPAQTRP